MSKNKHSNMFSIEWHKEGLKNNKLYLDRLIKQKECIESDIDRCLKGIKKIEAQIARAEMEGRTEFDAEKYNIKKK